jgi:hypothetical protein
MKTVLFESKIRKTQKYEWVMRIEERKSAKQYALLWRPVDKSKDNRLGNRMYDPKEWVHSSFFPGNLPKAATNLVVEHGELLESYGIW